MFRSPSNAASTRQVILKCYVRGDIFVERFHVPAMCLENEAAFFFMSVSLLFFFNFLLDRSDPVAEKALIKL